MKEEFTPKPDIKLGTYRHYSGKLYKVLGLACHSESLEWYVIYERLYEAKGMPKTWVRPYEMFTEDVIIDGQRMPRFSYIDSN